MFKYMSDKLIVYLATKFGLPDENLEKEKEVLELKKELIKEKLKHSENMETEVLELRVKVDDLTEEKIAKLEQENNRLRYENKQLQQLPYTNNSQQQDMLLSMDTIKKETIDYVMGNNKHEDTSLIYGTLDGEVPSESVTKRNIVSLGRILNHD